MAYQAIVTKYFGPTNSRGSRIKATCAAKTIIVAYDYSLNPENNHIAVANALAIKLEWTSDYYGKLVHGVMANGDYCHVFTKAE